MIGVTQERKFGPSTMGRATRWNGSDPRHDDVCDQDPYSAPGRSDTMPVQPRVLCLDDDPRVLEELERALCTDFRVVATTDPEVALRMLAEAGDDPFAVFIADMQMPVIDGVEVLQRAGAVSPSTTRVLLADDIDVADAMAAINQGHVFQLLLKPCPADELRATVAAATAQHREGGADKVPAGAAAAGTVEALLATLAQAQPALVERAHRMRGIAEKVCAVLEFPDAWQVELAAELTAVGAVTLPAAAVEAVITGIPRNDAEARTLDALLDRAAAVLAHVPALAPVRVIVRHQVRTDRDPFQPLPAEAPQAALVLQAIREYDALIHRGSDVRTALATLTARKTHAPALIAALAGYAGVGSAQEAREISVDELEVGDTLAGDVYSATGLQLAARGEVVTEAVLARIHDFHDSTGLLSRHLLVA
ncbi:hypothetical protein Areg01_38960 [Actinoplanes regularis]|nr:hypothetical protein Areg01_38960 [Actinoplanes regularis]